MQVMKIRAICISLWERLVTQSISAGNTTSLLFRGWLLLSLPFCVILQQPFTAYRAAVLPYLQYGRLSCCKAGRKGFEPLSPRFGVWYSTVWTTDPCAVYMGCMPTFKSRIPANTHIIFLFSQDVPATFPAIRERPGHTSPTGLEPVMRESKSRVLPLHHGPGFQTVTILYWFRSRCVQKEQYLWQIIPH